jgi:hypothetical protein
LQELAIRFIVAGLFVSAFAVLGDLFKPKSFAGLFGAAPSVALATLALTIRKDGHAFAASEARAMLAGAVALFVYCAAVTWLLKRDKLRALPATLWSAMAWFGTAFGIWYAWLR